MLGAKPEFRAADAARPLVLRIEGAQLRTPTAASSCGAGSSASTATRGGASGTCPRRPGAPS
eukprot:2894312-Alexandrium_andersonii.AAC.1